METAAVPHDLLKPVDWGHHNNPKRIVEEFGSPRLQGLLSKFFYRDWDPKGENVVRSLEYAVREHEGQRLFATADRLASAIGRLRYEWNYWGPRASEIFIVRVYGREGNVKRVKTGREPLNTILNILEKRCMDIEKCMDRDCQFAFSQTAFRELNEFLSEYPADSRFPLVNLKAHHWLTDAFRRSRKLWELCYKLNKSPERIGLIRCSILEQNLHRLKDLRAFRYYVDTALQFIESRVFPDRLPARIGDEIYIAYVEDEAEQLISELINKAGESGFLIKVVLHQWSVKKEGKERALFRITSLSEKFFSAGDPELPILVPEKAGAWAQELEESKNVLWINLRLSKSIEEAAKEFLDRAEEEVLSKMERSREKNTLKQEINLSPDLLISLAEGLEEFYMDSARILAGGSDPESVIVLRGLEEVLMVNGIEGANQAIEIYHSLDKIREKLLVSVDLVAILCDNKYPFWRVREIFNTNENCIVIVRGERLLRITSRDVPEIRRVAEIIERCGVTRSQMEEIVKEAGKVDGPEPLKLFIEAKARERKLGKENCEFVARQLANLIDSLYSRHRNMRVVQEALDLLSSYAKRESRRERE
ncbi:MAG: hypothetical protein QXK90_01490 [Candidatus Parvarchaeota archaeon]